MKTNLLPNHAGGNDMLAKKLCLDLFITSLQGCLDHDLQKKFKNWSNRWLYSWEICRCFGCHFVHLIIGKPLHSEILYTVQLPWNIKHNLSKPNTGMTANSPSAWPVLANNWPSSRILCSLILIPSSSVVSTSCLTARRKKKSNRWIIMITYRPWMMLFADKYSIIVHGDWKHRIAVTTTRVEPRAPLEIVGNKWLLGSHLLKLQQIMYKSLHVHSWNEERFFPIMRVHTCIPTFPVFIHTHTHMNPDFHLWPSITNQLLSRLREG